MEYRNKKTGKVIDVNSVMCGDWEPVKDEKKTAAKADTKTEKGKAKK